MDTNGNPEFISDNDESFWECSDAPSFDFVSLSGLNQSSGDVILDQYDSDDGSRLDAVLANVHRLMDCLKVVEIDESSLTSDNLVAKATQKLKTPESVDELILELCGDNTSQMDKDVEKAGLPEANPKPAAHSCDEKDLREANDRSNKDVIEPLLVELLKEGNDLAMTSEGAETSNSYVNKKTNIKLNLLNKQEPIPNFEDAQVSNKSLPSPETSTFISTKKANGENEKVLIIANHVKPKLSSKDQPDLSDIKSNGKKIFKKAKSENSSYFNSKILKVNSTQDNDSSKQPVTDSDYRPKEKKKLSASLSFAEKSTGNLRLFLPLKRKTSNNKEPGESRKISTEVKCANSKTQNEDYLRNNSAFAMQDLKSIPDEKSNKTDNKAARKKNFWNKEKKLSLGFRRSPSSEGKNFLGTNEVLKVHPNQAVLVTLEQSNSKPDSLNDSMVLKRRKKPILSGNKALSMYLDDEKTLEVLAKKRTSASPRLMTKLSTHFSLSPQNESDKKVARVDSEPKLPHKIQNEFETDEEVKRRRATMDSTPIRSKVRDSFVHRKNGLNDDDPHSPTYSSLPRKLHHSTGQAPITLSVAPYATTHGSNGSLKGSKDSLDDEDVKANLVVRQGRVKGLINMDEHQLEFLRSRLASSKTKKNLLRKSMRYVGKSTSIPSNDGDDNMAERTWLPEGDCSWRNLRGDRVGIESTRLQSLSELESDALRKVSLARLHEADLGVNIAVPKDESKVLDRKVSIKKRYGVHLTKEKKDKSFDHVFGIPLVNVVENDQLLRIQKSASFAPSLDYQQQSEQNETSGGVAQGSSPSSDVESSSGSTNSIHKNPGPQNQEEVSSPSASYDFNKSSSSSSNLHNDDSTPKSPEIDNVFSGKDAAGQTPTSAKSTGATAAQPLRRRGAIAADSINDIDPYQSQLLEALSLSVGGNTHSQKKVKKRSLLPPTMVQVPYVVQKCCDHLQKYGLNQAGIFRVPGSKKRVKQLREQFDRGIDVTIDETYNPHDVAALLKEFFRDLPEALLTRELYPAFLQTTKLHRHNERLACLRYLVWLLPLTHRDTLHTLLKFLALVAAHSEDTVDSSGNKVFGNKMNVMNLATIFGPNILHRYKKSTPSNGDSHHYQVQTVEKPEENSAVIKVMEDVISNQVLLFQIPKEEHNQMLRILKETDPEAVDFLLRRKAAHHMRHKSRLLGSHSNSPNSSHNFSHRLLPSFEDVSPETQSPSDSDADIPERVRSLPEPESVEAGRPAVMRLSYQHATGHALIPSPNGDKQEKPGAVLKFKRPFFMKSKSHPSPAPELDSPAMPDHDHMSGFTEVNEISDDTDDLKNDHDCLQISPIAEDNVSNGSAWSTQSHHLRSMSFTDDDLEAILGGKSASNSRSELSKAKLKFEGSENCGFDDCGELKQLEDLEIYEDESRSVEKTIPEEDAFADESDNIIRAAHSSDSGVYVDYSKKLINSASDPVKRRGGFSLDIAPNEDPELDEDSGLKIESQSEEHLFEKADKNESTTDHVEPDLDKRKDSVLENSCESSGENDDVVPDVTGQNKAAERLFIQKSEPKQNEDSVSKSIQSTSSSESISHGSSGDNFTYLNLDTAHESESTLRSNSESQTEDKPEVCDVSPSSFEQVSSALLPSPTIQDALRPKVKRQFASSSYSQVILNAPAGETTLNNRNINDGDATPKSKGESDHEDSTKLGVFRSEKANLVIKSSPSHRASSRGVNVAILAGKYSKDDKALLNETKPASGSKWTSSGFIGARESCKTNKASNRPKSDKKKITPLNNNVDLPPWHAAVNDLTHLRDTLV